MDIRSLEILDEEKSEWEYDEETGWVDMVDKLVFREDQLQDAHLFKIMDHGPYLASMIFLSDTLKQAIKEHNLTGLDFIPHPRLGNLIWDSEGIVSEGLDFKQFTKYAILSIQYFVDFFSQLPENESIRAFSVKQTGVRN